MLVERVGRGGLAGPDGTGDLALLMVLLSVEEVEEGALGISMGFTALMVGFSIFFSLGCNTGILSSLVC